MPSPPLLPDAALARVLRLARFDGMSVLVLGGIFALAAAAGRHVPFAAIGLLAAGAGAVELHGANLLRQGVVRGMRWVIASQPLLLAVILTYCVLRLWIVGPSDVPEAMRGLFAASAAQWNLSLEDYVVTLNRLTALAVGTVAVGFQGAMTIYYWRRRRDVARALEAQAETGD
jgi:hypothetical protein